MQFEVSVEVEARAAAVWAQVVAVEAWPRWTGSMREVRWLGRGGMAVGARARVRQPALPARVWTVCRLDPGHSFIWRSQGPGLKTLAAHWIAPLGRGRTLLTLEIVHAGPLAWLAGLLTGARTCRYLEMEAAGLKRAAEEAVVDA